MAPVPTDSELIDKPDPDAPHIILRTLPSLSFSTPTHFIHVQLAFQRPSQDKPFAMQAAVDTPSVHVLLPHQVKRPVTRRVRKSTSSTRRWEMEDVYVIKLEPIDEVMERMDDRACQRINSTFDALDARLDRVENLIKDIRHDAQAILRLLERMVVEVPFDKGVAPTSGPAHARILAPAPVPNPLPATIPAPTTPEAPSPATFEASTPASTRLDVSAPTASQVSSSAMAQDAPLQPPNPSNLNPSSSVNPASPMAPSLRSRSPRSSLRAKNKLPNFQWLGRSASTRNVVDASDALSPPLPSRLATRLRSQSARFSLKEAFQRLLPGEKKKQKQAVSDVSGDEAEEPVAGPSTVPASQAFEEAQHRRLLGKHIK